MQWRATLILFLLHSVCDNYFRYKREPLAMHVCEEIETRASRSLCLIYLAHRLSVNEKSPGAFAGIAMDPKEIDGWDSNRAKGRDADDRSQSGLKESPILKNFGIKFSQIEGLPYRAFIHTWFNTFRSAS